jgi:hypothetical protein
MMNLILADMPLPLSNEQWTRKPVSRKEFNELSIVTPEMSRDEITRRIRATSFEKWQPYVELQGYRFEYKP